MLATLPKNVDEKMQTTLPKDVGNTSGKCMLATLSKNVDEKMLATFSKKMLTRKNVGNTSGKC
jgi:hypothetical protein